MDHEILFWMKADHDYLAGLALFERYTHNTKIGRMLRIGGATVKNRLTLSYELSKIAKHLAAFENASALVKPPVKQETSKPLQPLPPEVTTITRLRSEQKMCYKMLDNLHAVLPFREIQERKEIAFRILDIDDQLKEITKRIAHYETNGVIPPAPVNDEPKKVSEMGEAELIIRQNNVRTYIARYKRLVADVKKLKTLPRNQELLDKFQLELDEITERLNK
ncbi:MAG: hypothetical protein Q8M08_05030 [Bacteroidales bacterium]|nr:hypothetical protein [Bacteroidales bacterium]